MFIEIIIIINGPEFELLQAKWICMGIGGNY